MEDEQRREGMAALCHLGGGGRGRGWGVTERDSEGEEARKTV